MVTSDKEPGKTPRQGSSRTPQGRTAERIPEPDPAEGDSTQVSPEPAAVKYANRSFYLPVDLVERARACVPGVQAAVYGTPEEDEAPASVAQLVKVALERECQRLEDRFNDGKPFRRVYKKLQPGPSREGAERGAAKRRRAAESDT